MVAKSPGRNRPVNVDVSLDLKDIISRLSRATNWCRESVFIHEDGKLIPGSPESSWCVADPGRFAVEYLWSEVLSKYDDGSPSPEKMNTAMAKFREAEEMCALTNKRFSRLEGLPSHLACTFVEKAITLARSKIRTILGPFSWEAASRGFTFTSGASTRLPRARGQQPYKYSGTPETTFGNANLAWAAIQSTPAWKRSLSGEEGPTHLKLVSGNSITTVPKNYKMDRVIAVEPCMNMYVQKGIAALIRHRLKRAGMDLQTQERNQRLARVGSIAGTLATIDMSMASDTVSLELVRFLLPRPWADALEQCRSQQGVLPSGDVVYYRKFSSMGNGYTFELESLIFWALALAVCELMGLEAHRVVSYGDDVILPTAAAPRFVELLEFCGFKANAKKTFADNSGFRESCGKHYLHGLDVTPFYIKRPVRRLTDLFLLHNRIRRWLNRQSWNNSIDHIAVEDLLRDLRNAAPASWRKPRIPDGYGDGAFIGSFDEATPKVACTYRPGRVGKRDGWEGFICQVVAEVTVVADFYDEGFGVMRGKRFSHRSGPPDVVGRLLQSLSNIGRHHDDQSLGGVSLPPRERVVDILVPLFP